MIFHKEISDINDMWRIPLQTPDQMALNKGCRNYRETQLNEVLMWEIAMELSEYIFVYNRDLFIII